MVHADDVAELLVISQWVFCVIVGVVAEGSRLIVVLIVAVAIAEFGAEQYVPSSCCPHCSSYGCWYRPSF